MLVHFDNLLVSVFETDFWLCLPKNLGSYDDSIAVHECDCEIFFTTCFDKLVILIQFIF